MNFLDQVNLTQARSDVDFLIPKTLEECLQQLRQTQRECWAVAKDSFHYWQEEQDQKIANLQICGDKPLKKKIQIICHL